MNTQEEYDKCMADPVYFYENYLTINGKPAPPLPEQGKRLLRTYVNGRTKGMKVVLRVPPRSKMLFKRVFEADVTSAINTKLNNDSNLLEEVF